MNANPADKKIVIILGAGSTYADADNVPEYEKPPLNNKFFANTQSSLKQSRSDSKESERLLENIKIYFLREHSIDIFSDDDDSLEKVMSKLYLDVHTSSKTAHSFPVFRDFLTLFYDRLGETTNNMTIDHSKLFYRIVSNYIRNGINPDNLIIISFNYDIFAEKILATLARSFFNPSLTIFSFRYCYKLNLELNDFTQPDHISDGIFPIYPNDQKSGGITFLKLHGSLNWYSYYHNDKIDLADMFNPNRSMKVSREEKIRATKLKYRSSIEPRKTLSTLPVIVPPVPNKSEIYHQKILDLWIVASVALREADELLIYGYSCPPLDKDSRSLLKESLKVNKKIQKISVIDTDPTIFDHYRGLIDININYYHDANSFLEESGG